MTEVYVGIKLEPPFNFTKVRVGLGGRHYHNPECKASHPETGFGGVLNPVASDYAEIEVPKILIDKGVPIRYLNRLYEPCLMCLFLSQRKS